MKERNEKAYYTVAEAAEILNCIQPDVIHYGAIGKLRIATYIDDDSKRGRKVIGYPYDGTNWFRFSSGLYYLHKEDVRKLEFTPYQGTIKISSFYPTDALKYGGSCPLYPSEFINNSSIPSHIIDGNILLFIDTNDFHMVDHNALVVLHDDMMEFQKESPPLEKSKKEFSQKENQKANASLLKMVISMAIDGYGYNPADKKSPIPAQIVTCVAARGLSINVDTVRNWLKEAAVLLSGDDEPFT